MHGHARTLPCHKSPNTRGGENTNTKACLSLWGGEVHGQARNAPSSQDSWTYNKKTQTHTRVLIRLYEEGCMDNVDNYSSQWIDRSVDGSKTDPDKKCMNMYSNNIIDKLEKRLSKWRKRFYHTYWPNDKRYNGFLIYMWEILAWMPCGRHVLHHVVYMRYATWCTCVVYLPLITMYLILSLHFLIQIEKIGQLIKP